MLVTKKKHFTVILSVLLMSSTVLFAQTVSDKKDIAVFQLSHTNNIPMEIVSKLDRHITAVIASFKRFNVIGMQYRLRTSDVSIFIDKIKETKENQSEIPETVLSGEESFTRADWEKLTGSFLVFVPRITEYDEQAVYADTIVDGKKVTQKYWEVKIEGSVTIIDVSGTMGQRVLPLSAKQIMKRKTDAVNSAVDAIGVSVYTAIKFEPEFALASGILDINRRKNTVTIQLGRDMGIKEGDEYTVQKGVSVGGLQSSSEAGFLIISEVHDTFSIGKIVYATQPIVEGDAVKERPRFNFDLQPYIGISVPLTGVQTKQPQEYFRIQPTFGFKATYWTSFHLGLLLGYEYAIQQPFGKSTILAEKPLRLSPFGMGYLGVSVYNFYAARFKISPELHFCFAGIGIYPQPADTATPKVKKFMSASQLGGRATIAADYFITRTWTIGVNAGIGYMHSLISAEQAAKKLQDSGALSASDAARVTNYDWDILSSHLNLYLFLGITKRF